MWLKDLQSLTSLPVEHVRHRFRNEEVVAVLPTLAPAGQDSILVATPPKLAVVVGGGPMGGYWMTYWTSWDTVRIADDEASEDGWYGLRVSIGERMFQARLHGLQGQRALRDFVVAVQAQQHTLVAF